MQPDTINRARKSIPLQDKHRSEHRRRGCGFESPGDAVLAGTRSGPGFGPAVGRGAVKQRNKTNGANYRSAAPTPQPHPSLSRHEQGARKRRLMGVWACDVIGEADGRGRGELPLQQDEPSFFIFATLG